MNSLRVFDKEGNELHISDIIYQFISDKAEHHKVGVDEIMISIYNGKLVIDLLESSGNANYFNELEVIDLNAKR